MALRPVTMQMVAGWVKQWVESLYLRRRGSQTLDGSLTVTGNATVTGDLAVTGSSSGISYTDLDDVPSTFAPSAHATSHKHSGMDEVGTSTPTANAIIKADGDGKIGAGWIDDADIDHGSIGGLTDDDHTGYARLDGRSTGQTLNGAADNAGSLTMRATAGAGGGGTGTAIDAWTGTDPGDYKAWEADHNGDMEFPQDVSVGGDLAVTGVVDGDSYIRSNFGGFSSQQLPAVNNGQTLTITITTSSANNNWQHLTRISIAMGQTSAATSRVLYHALVGWSQSTIGSSATVRATSVAINDAVSATVTGATATTNGFTITVAATANFAASRSYLLVEDLHINNITIGTAVA